MAVITKYLTLDPLNPQKMFIGSIIIMNNIHHSQQDQTDQSILTRVVKADFLKAVREAVA